MKTKNTLEKLIELDKDHKVSSALAGVIFNNSLDMKINAIGAMHTSGWLKNRMNPFWKEYNHGTDEWIEKSINRAIENDHDDYAVSALLNCSIQSTLSILKKIGMILISTRCYTDYKKGEVYVLTFANDIDKHSKKVLPKILEFGWVNETDKIIEVAAMRALIFYSNYELKDNQVFGKHYFTYYRKATLPFGNLNLTNSQLFEYREEESILNKLNIAIKNELTLIN